MAESFESRGMADLRRTRTFTVGVTAPGVSGGGHLHVVPNSLVCELGPIAKRVSGIASVTHAGSVVHIYRARLIPFWFNVAAIIDDGSVAVGASTWAFGLNSFVKALNAAGFTVEVHRTWFFRGLHFSDVVSRTNGRAAKP